MCSLYTKIKKKKKQTKYRSPVQEDHNRLGKRFLGPRPK